MKKSKGKGPNKSCSGSLRVSRQVGSNTCETVNVVRIEDLIMYSNMDVQILCKMNWKEENKISFGNSLSC